MSNLSLRDNCYRMLYKILEEDAFSNLCLDNNASAFERAAVYGTITYTHAIDFLIAHYTRQKVNDMDPSTRTIMRFATWQMFFSTKVPDYAAISTSLELGSKYNRKSIKYINALLSKLSKVDKNIRNLDSFRPDIRVSLPSELFGIIKRDYGLDEAIDIGLAFLSNPYTTIRFNNRKVTKDKVVSLLREDKIEVNDSLFADEALILSSFEDVPLEKTMAFKQGIIYAQSEASMLPAIISCASSGMRILDLCSAPGGKITHIVEKLDSDCDVTAVDINESRLKLIKDNISRLGLKNIKLTKGDATSFYDGSLYDIVLADVPCSGLGLIKRKPDIRLKLTYERIKELIPKQSLILNNAARSVREKGILIYSTCTINKDENERVVFDFLKHNPEFYLEDISALVPDKLINTHNIEDLHKGYVTLLPNRDGTDGFFVARLRRKEAQYE